MTKSSIWFVHPGNSTFVRKDVDILRKRYRVHITHYRSSKNIIRFTYEVVSQLFFACFLLWRYHAVYIWFADYHSLIPAFFGRLLGKKVIVVVGGFDAVAIPELGYGVFVKENFRAWCAAKTYRLAHLILPVDQSLIKGRNTYADHLGPGLPVGVKHFCPSLTAHIEVLPTGYDETVWKYDVRVKRQPEVITIASVSKMQTFKLKGIDLLIETARLTPETQFTIAGLSDKMRAYVASIAPPNVIALGPFESHELPSLLSRHKVFAQLSLSEGLPNTLCEAMLCGCIPIGSKVNGIPRAIGTYGFILEKPNAHEAAQLVAQALDAPASYSIAGREHIIRNYHATARDEKLHRLLHKLLKR